MNIGELFVSLGIKGGKETQGTLKGVKSEMKNVKSVSIEAKAAILATVYGLKTLMSQSMQNGTAIAQFSNLTGLSTKKLQQWQYANKMAGGSAEEVTGMIGNMQSAFAQLELGEGPAKYMGLFAEGLSKVGESLDPEKMNDAFYTLEKFRAFVKAGGSGNIGVDNEVGRSLGISDNVIGGSRAGMFDEGTLSKAKTYSDSQAKELQRLQGMWTDLGDTIQKEIGKLNSKFGGQLVKDISAIAKELTSVVSGVVELANSLKAFELIQDSLRGWVLLLKEVKGIVLEIDSAVNKKRTGEEQIAFKERESKGMTDQFFGGLKVLYGELGNAVMGSNPAPNMAYQGSQASSDKALVVNQTINVGDASNALEVKQAAKAGVIQAAYRQIQANGG